MAQPFAILIVNGGNGPNHGRWLNLCLDKIQDFTDNGTYQIYLWNNDLADKDLKSRFLDRQWITYLEAAPYEHLAHPHAIPLQRLYTLAREQSAEIIVTLDSDAHPLRQGWLLELVKALASGAALAGIWRDELNNGIAPYVHPACLATSVDFIERQHLRFDRIHCLNDTGQHDTLSHFTAAACAANLPIHRLRRSNVNNFHRLMGGIYGDLIYHHGAGSRGTISFWGDPKNPNLNRQQALLCNALADLLFSEYEQYLSWLRGHCPDDTFNTKLLDLQQFPASEKIKSNPLSILSAAKKIVGKAANNHGDIRSLIRKIPGARQFARILHLGRKPQKTLADMKAKMLRPIMLTDLHDLPYGWRVTGPSFIGLGAPKCGTGWWYSLLIDHPQVVVNRTKFIKNKELHYFVHFQNQPMSAAEIDCYRQCFAAPPGAICGEFSTSYLSYPNCLEQVALAEPNTKLLVILRNPIDRTLSHLNHMIVHRAHWFHNQSAAQVQLFRKYSFYCEAALHSLYAVGLRRLLHYFDRSQILVLQYENCSRNPKVELARTYRFLGLNDSYLPNNLQRKINVFPYVLQRHTPEERAHLVAYFADDVKQTAELFPELDMNLWPDFSKA